MNDIERLKSEMSMAVSHAKSDVKLCDYCLNKENSDRHRDCLRKAKHNLDIFQTCSDLMEELYLDDDDDDD